MQASKSKVKVYMGQDARKPVFRGLGTTQVHPCGLINTFVFHFLDSIICKLATCEISIFKLVSVAEEAGLHLALSETPKTGFIAMRPILYTLFYVSFLQMSKL